MLVYKLLALYAVLTEYKLKRTKMNMQMLSFFFNLKLDTDFCTLPQRTGVCRAMFHRWFYNPKSGQCELFTYGGCDGNANNFQFKRQCEQACTTPLKQQKLQKLVRPLVTGDTTCAQTKLPFIGLVNLCRMIGV